MRILLSGGGTAGHAWPIILVGQALKKNKRNKLLYVGSGGIEKELAKQAEIPFRRIVAGKRRNYSSILNFLDVFKTLFGICQAFFVLLAFRPEVILAKGGYVTLPILIWVNFFKIPLVIHESDSVIGRANAFALSRAKKICLGFPVEVYQNLNLPLEKVIYTGIPVGEEFFQTPVRAGDRLNLLITGGSQGSSRINHLIEEILPRLIDRYEIWHICGKLDYEELSKFKDHRYHLLSFSYEMGKFVRDADLIITRAGASTLAEISAAGKASIIIPLPESAGNHQVINAKVYQDRNAAVVLSENRLSSESFLSIINNLMSDDDMRKILGHHAQSLSRRGAVGEIVDILFEVAENAKAKKR